MWHPPRQGFVPPATKPWSYKYLNCSHISDTSTTHTSQFKENLAESNYGFALKAPQIWAGTSHLFFWTISFIFFRCPALSECWNNWSKFECPEKSVKSNFSWEYSLRNLPAVNPLAVGVSNLCLVFISMGKIKGGLIGILIFFLISWQRIHLMMCKNQP